MNRERTITEIDGRRLSLSNLDKVLYPATGFTKGQVIDYYARISEVMVPHLRDRPVTLKRYPNGVEGEFFFEKRAPAHMPEWIPIASVPSRSGTHDPIRFAVIGERAGLIWAANLAALEFHVPLWRLRPRKSPPSTPDYMVFDLDPGPGTSIVECCHVALWIAEHLGRENLFAKTSGSKGLQLYTALSGMSSEEASNHAHVLAQEIERTHPEEVVSLMRKALRNDKVLIDWSQNNPSKTTVAAYSLRARAQPTVSTPITWEEVTECARVGNPDLLRFDGPAVLDRVEHHGDLMAPLLTKARKSTLRKPRAERSRTRNSENSSDTSSRHQSS